MVAWHVLTESVRGASHQRNGLPNQDAIKTFQSASNLFPLIVAVADGHGSPRCTHSHIGAQFAVDAAIEIIQQAFALPELTLPQVKVIAEAIPKSIYRCWQDKVNKFYKFKVKKINGLININSYLWSHYYFKSQTIKADLKNPYLPFGTTLLAACFLGNCILYWQIGDGDIVIIQSDGTTMLPIQHDIRLLGNDTTSLCKENAWVDFRNAFLPTIDKPKAIFLVSDGYKNSFKYKEGFDLALAEILCYIKEDGAEWVQHELSGWLNEASQEGSGDDISVAIIYS